MQIPLTPSFMTSCIYIALDDLILVIIIAFQLGYLYAKRKLYKRYKQSQNICHSLQPLSLSIQTSTQQVEEREVTSIKQRLQRQEKKEQIHNIEKQQNSLSKQFLLQKIALEGKKIQSRGIFHMTLEQSENSKFLRKIEKHEIITDYQIEQNKKNFQIIPANQQFFSLADEKSILEINAYQNFKFKDVSPLLQKKLLKMNQFDSFNNQFHIHLAPSLCQNGKFNKFFSNKKKIGEGAFGTVFSAINILQGKQYAIKKLFIKRQTNHQKMQKMLNQTIKQVNIISKYSHPNIVRFHTCWIQIANLNQALNFNKMEFESIQKLSQNQTPFLKKRNSHTQEYVEVSYVSSNYDSGIQFANSPSVTKKSIIQSQKEQTRIIPSNKNINTNIENKTENQQDFHPVYTLYIQMELCNEGTLWNYLNLRKYIDRKFSFIVFQQLLFGVQYLHKNGLVHRDLKPGNILINKRQKQIKIGDFGLSINLSEQIIKNKGVGTPSYIAPQILQNREIKKEEYHLTDVYSIGVIYFQMLNMFNKATRHQRIQKLNNLKINVVQLQRQYNLQGKLIKAMTKSRGRPSIDSILKKKQFIQLKQLFSLEKNSNDWECMNDLTYF